MTEPAHRHLLIWEARHDNGWIVLVMEQSDGTFVAWAGPDETVGVDYVEDTPEHAQAAAMFALERKSGHAECSPRCSELDADAHDARIAARAVSAPPSNEQRIRDGAVATSP